MTLLSKVSLILALGFLVLIGVFCALSTVNMVIKHRKLFEDLESLSIAASLICTGIFAISFIW